MLRVSLKILIEYLQETSVVDPIYGEMFGYDILIECNGVTVVYWLRGENEVGTSRKYTVDELHSMKDPSKVIAEYVAMDLALMVEEYNGHAFSNIALT